MKEKTLYLDTPPIDINQLSEQNSFQIDFDLTKNDFIGMLKIRLDPDNIEWDTHNGEDEFPRSCSRLIISVTTELDISETQFLENTYFLVIEYLIIFFNYLQIELGQYWVDVGSIRDWDLITLLDKTIARRVVADGKEKISIPIGSYRKKIIFSPRRRTLPEITSGLDVKQIPDIKSWLEEHKEPDLPKLLLADSKRNLLHNDYKSSSILAITALEGPLEKFVKERCNKKEIKLKSRFIGYYMELFPKLLETNELSVWLDAWMEDQHIYSFAITSHQIIDWASQLIQERNDAVHRGELPKFSTLDKGIFAVEAIIEFVKEGIK